MYPLYNFRKRECIIDYVKSYLWNRVRYVKLKYTFTSNNNFREIRFGYKNEKYKCRH